MLSGLSFNFPLNFAAPAAHFLDFVGVLAVVHRLGLASKHEGKNRILHRVNKKGTTAYDIYRDFEKVYNAISTL